MGLIGGGEETSWSEGLTGIFRSSLIRAAPTPRPSSRC